MTLLATIDEHDGAAKHNHRQNPPEEVGATENLINKEAWGDVDGRELNLEKAVAARQVELRYHRGMETYDLAPIAECWQRTKATPFGVRWIDHNKGDRNNEAYRPRLVGKQYNNDRWNVLFAATPTLEPLKMIPSECSTGHQRKCLMAIGVPRAHMYAPTPDDKYVEIVAEGPIRENTRRALEVKEQHARGETRGFGMATTHDCCVATTWLCNGYCFTMYVVTTHDENSAIRAWRRLPMHRRKERA